MLLVTYDEHGGFFDHVAPIAMPATVAGQNIVTTGVRVPAFLISPWVGEGDVFKGALDHTSILQLLADRFAPGEGYSLEVNERQARLQRLEQALDETIPRHQRPEPPDNAQAVSSLAAALATPEAPMGASPADPDNRESLSRPCA